MPTSVYFNNQESKIEQQLLEDLIIESIRNHGIDVYYIPRRSQSNTDTLFGDDPVKCFNNAYKVEMFLESARDYVGNKEFFSKFGLDIQESANLVVSRRTFERLVFSKNADRKMPKEGDLIFLTHQHKLMEVKFVEEEKNFFQLGKDKVNPYMYGLSVEAFKYNGELFQTGVAIIDQISESRHTTSTTACRLVVLEHSKSLNGSIRERASLLLTPKAVVSAWDKPSRVLKLRNIMGAFAEDTVIVGSKSGAQWYLQTQAEEMENANASRNMEDNIIIENEASNILDFSGTQPIL